MATHYLLENVSHKQRAMYTGFVIVGALLLCGLIHWINVGNVEAVVIASLIAAVVIPIVLMSCRPFEHRMWHETLSSLHHSWAYQYGDPFGLCLAMAVSAVAWRDHGDRFPAFFHQETWMVISFAIAIAFGIAFRAKENPRYTLKSRLSPFKVYHDWILVPLLVAVLVSKTVPLLSVFDWTTWVALAGVVFWLVLAQIDEWRTKLPKGHRLRLIARRQHHEWNARRFAPVY